MHRALAVEVIAQRAFIHVIIIVAVLLNVVRLLGCFVGPVAL